MQEMSNKDYTDSEVDLEEVDEPQPKRDTSKVYFFILAIIALLATNTYFYFKYKTSTNHTYELGNEKTLMQEEINQIEAELNRLTSENLEVSHALQSTQDSVRTLIQQLRNDLENNDLSREKLAKAQQEIHKLRQEVGNYRNSLTDLKSANDLLQDEKDRLRLEIQEKDKILIKLEDSTIVLNEQIKSASKLKLSKINLVGLREKNSREETESRARRVDKIRIHFNIVDNPLVEHGKVNVYLRIIDPSGNLNTTPNQFFELEGTPMQYTTKTEIEFTNLGEEYSLDWVDENKFKKGIYTVLLYTEQSTMGRASIVLN